MSERLRTTFPIVKCYGRRGQRYRVRSVHVKIHVSGVSKVAFIEGAARLELRAESCK